MTEKSAYNSEQWRLLIQQQKESGLTVKDWCDQNHLSRSRFYYWISKMRKKEFPEAIRRLPEQVSQACMVDITPPEIENPRNTCVANDASLPTARIVKNGITIELTNSASNELIHYLVTEMRYA